MLNNNTKNLDPSIIEKLVKNDIICVNSYPDAFIALMDKGYIRNIRRSFDGYVVTLKDNSIFEVVEKETAMEATTASVDYIMSNFF